MAATQNRDMGSGSIPKLLAQLALPAVVAQVVNLLYNIVDRIYIGHMPEVGASALTGVGLFTPILMLITAFAMLCGSGGAPRAAIAMGRGDDDAAEKIMGNCFTLLLILAAVLTVVFYFAAPSLLVLFGASEKTLPYALDYARIYIIGTIFVLIVMGMNPFVTTQGFATFSMMTTVIGAVCNIILDPILIFGLFGFPALGVVGAGIATSLSRFVEFVIVVSGAHRSAERYPFMEGVFRNFHIDGNLARQVAIKGFPLLLNECLWSMSQAMLLQCYSVRGIQAIAAMNITSTITQIFNEVFLSLGNATAILVGQELGASRMTGARRTAWRMITLSVSSCAVMGTLLALFSPLIPHIYNTEPAIRELASSVIRTAALCMPRFAFANAAYFTLRSGGKTLITFFFDSCYTWLINFPIAFVLSRYTALPLPIVYLFVNGVDLLKCIIGFILVKKGVWVNNIVASSQDVPQAD